MKFTNNLKPQVWFVAELERLRDISIQFYRKTVITDVLMLMWIINSSGWLLISQLLSEAVVSILLIAVLGLFLLANWYKKLRLLSLLIPVTLLSLSWSSWQFATHKSLILPAQYESVDLELIGQVVGLPSKQTERTQFNFRLDKHKNTEFGRWANGETILLSCYRCQWQFNTGEQWLLTVRLKRPRGFASWGSFDYEKFLFRKKIVAKGYIRTKSKNRLLASQSNSLKQLRANTKQQLLTEIDIEKPSEPQQVAQAMILALAIGDKSDLSNDARKVFQVTGVSHLFAISGLHIGLMFFVVAWLTGWLSRLTSSIYYLVPRQHLVLLPGLIAALYYSSLAGFAVSTQRALIMLAVFVFCKWSNRPTPLLRVLLIAATIILIYDPFSILDIGFWLSCGAVLVIALSSSRFENLRLVYLQPLLWLGMMPLTILLLPQFSLISPLVNLICVPLFCVVLIPLLLFALFCNQLGLSGLSAWLFDIINYCFSYIYLGLSWLAEQPFASAHFASLNAWVLLAIALVLLVSLFAVRTGLLLLIAGLGFYYCFDQTSDSDYQVTLLDVGQGLSMVIQVDDYTLLYDVGPAYPSGFNTAEAVVLPYLRYSSIDELDHLVISHADHDHIGSLPWLLQQIPVKRISTSRTDRIANSSACVAGQKWQIDKVELEFLSPDTNTPQGSNNRSCVLSISNGKVRTLITGDIEKQVERYLLNSNQNLEAQIMLVPHQGSKTSSTNAFIEAVSPQIGLVAAGYRNHYGHPHPKVVKRYWQRDIELLSTVELGSITLTVNSEQISLQSYRRDNARFWHD